MDIHEELESLLFDWEAGTLGDDGVARLREILKSSPAAREFYLRQQMLTAAMKIESETGFDLALPGSASTSHAASSQETGSKKASTKKASPRRSVSSDFERGGGGMMRVSLWLVAAAVLLICGLVGRITYLELVGEQSPPTFAETESPAADEPQEATSHGVALLTRLVDVEWADDQSPLEVGDAVAPGNFSIESGFAQVEFFCGATVIVEGPAALELTSPTHAKVLHGRLRAQVPPAARGFSLDVDDMKVVDLGTEFGLSVTSEGSDLQVFDGEVELHRAAEPKQLIRAGEAVRTADGQVMKAPLTPSRFTDIASLGAQADGQRTARFERWREWSRRIRSDSRLIAYYAFDTSEPWIRKLKSDLEPKNDDLDGGIVGARRTRGRWTEKSGLEFKRPGDRVRVQIPGEFNSLTFACWVKIDSLDRWYNSLFLTDNYNQGEPHWQILQSGQLFFSVRHRPDRGADPHGPAHQPVLSPPFWKPALSGRWLHIATTYESDTGRTRHFLNGEMLHEEFVPGDLLVETTRIGAASIGNWSLPTKPNAEFAIRNLNGSMDEFAIFSAALTKDEIKEIFKNGKP